jgi:hypothetical protein
LTDLPKDLVRVGVVTGLEGIGQSSDYESLMDVARDASAVLTPQGLAAEINGGDFLRRLLTYRSIKTDGLIKTADQKSAEQQQSADLQQQQTLMDKGVGPIAQGGMDMIAQALQQQQGTENVGR